MRKTLSLNTAATVAPTQVETQAPVAANDAAPKAARARLQMPNFVATLMPTAIEIKDGQDGRPYMVLKGCEMELPNGQTATRTAMVFDDAFDAVREQIRDLKDIVVTLAPQLSTVKVVGVLVDGEMKTFERKLPLAA